MRNRVHPRRNLASLDRIVIRRPQHLPDQTNIRQTRIKPPINTTHRQNHRHPIMDPPHHTVRPTSQNRKRINSISTIQRRSPNPGKRKHTNTTLRPNMKRTLGQPPTSTNPTTTRTTYTRTTTNNLPLIKPGRRHHTPPTTQRTRKHPATPSRLTPSIDRNRPQLPPLPPFTHPPPRRHKPPTPHHNLTPNTNHTPIPNTTLTHPNPPHNRRQLRRCHIKPNPIPTRPLHTEQLGQLLITHRQRNPATHNESLQTPQLNRTHTTKGCRGQGSAWPRSVA